jgi:hypothetical protein
MTLGNMRQLGVQRLIASRLNPKCRHDGLIEVFGYPPETEITYFSKKVVCAKCGEPGRHIDVRPNWKEHPSSMRPRRQPCSRGLFFSPWSVASKTQRLRFDDCSEPSRGRAVHLSYSGWGFRILDRRTAMRAMPMLFWLPMIFASALWEMNGFPPQSLANNHPPLG